MYSYGLLEPGCYYLVQEKTDSEIELISASVETDHCMYVTRYKDEVTTEWKKKTDQIVDIIECLNDNMVAAWQAQYNESYHEEDEE